MDGIANELELSAESAGWYTLGPTGLQVTGNPTYDQWSYEYRSFQGLKNALPFWLGDLANAGQDRFGEDYAQAVLATGMAVQTLYNYASVCRHVPPEIRQAGLSFHHHSLVAYLEPEMRDNLLAQAAAEDWPSAILRDKVRAYKLLIAPVTVPDDLPPEPVVELAPMVERDFDAMANDPTLGLPAPVNAVPHGLSFSYSDIAIVYDYLAAQRALPEDVMGVLERIETAMLAV